MGFQIKVLNLDTDETLIATLDSFDDAVRFLQERPPMMEILTVISDVSPAEMRKLKEAMRPYDAEEKTVLARRAEMRAEMVRGEQEAEQRRAQEAAEAERLRASSSDPDRPVKVRWTLDEGFSAGDAFDDRPLTDTIKDAVTAWVAERNEWVKSRGQFVAECDVEVWPNEVPQTGDGTRVLRGGSFIPRLKEDRRLDGDN
jgi:hypothetical protein